MSDNVKFPFGEAFQLALLKLMIKDESFLVRSIKYLNSNYFSNKYLEYFFNLIKRFYYDHNICPDSTYFDNEIRKLHLNEQKKYEKYFVKIHKASTESKQYILNNLVGFVRCNMFVDLYNQMPDLYGQDHDKAFQYTAESIEKLLAVDFEEDVYLSFKDINNIINEANKEKADALRIGINKIDQALNGGVHNGDLCVFLGDTNAGKSVVLLNLLYLSVKQNKKVLFLNLEGRRGQPLLRLASRVTNIPYNRVLLQQFINDAEKEFYTKTISKYLEPEMFQIRNLHDRKVSQNLIVTVEDVYALCQEVKKTFDFDVLIIDYGDRLDTRKKCSNRTEAQRIVYESLDNMAKKFDIPVITASQVTRPDSESRSEGWLRMKDVAEAYAKVKVAAVVLSINRSEREKLEGRVRVLLDKSRDGETNIKVGCYSDYSRMTPYDEEKLKFFNLDEVI